jgi:hypothetical protein
MLDSDVRLGRTPSIPNPAAAASFSPGGSSPNNKGLPEPLVLWLRVGTGGASTGDVGEVGVKLFIDLVAMWWEVFVPRGFAIRLANDCWLLDM